MRENFAAPLYSRYHFLGCSIIYNSKLHTSKLLHTVAYLDFLFLFFPPSSAVLQAVRWGFSQHLRIVNKKEKYDRGEEREAGEGMRERYNAVPSGCFHNSTLLTVG